MGEAGAAPHRCRAEHAAETPLLPVTPGEALAMPTSPPPGHRQEARPGQSPPFRARRALGDHAPHDPMTSGLAALADGRALRADRWAFPGAWRCLGRSWREAPAGHARHPPPRVRAARPPRGFLKPVRYARVGAEPEAFHHLTFDCILGQWSWCLNISGRSPGCRHQLPVHTRRPGLAHRPEEGVSDGAATAGTDSSLPIKLGGRPVSPTEAVRELWPQIHADPRPVPSVGAGCQASVRAFAVGDPAPSRPEGPSGGHGCVGGEGALPQGLSSPRRSEQGARPDPAPRLLPELGHPGPLSPGPPISSALPPGQRAALTPNKNQINQLQSGSDGQPALAVTAFTYPATPPRACARLCPGNRATRLDCKRVCVGCMHPVPQKCMLKS